MRGGGRSRPQISAHDLNHMNMPDGNVVNTHTLDAYNTNAITDNNFSKAVEGKNHLINDWIFKNNITDDELCPHGIFVSQRSVGGGKKSNR